MENKKLPLTEAQVYHLLDEAQTQAEDVQSMFSGIMAILRATSDSVRTCFRNAPFEPGIQNYLNCHASHVQDLLAAALHLLSDVEDRQDDLVTFLINKNFQDSHKQNGVGHSNIVA